MRPDNLILNIKSMYLDYMYGIYPVIKESSAYVSNILQRSSLIRYDYVVLLAFSRNIESTAAVRLLRMILVSRSMSTEIIY